MSLKIYSVKMEKQINKFPKQTRITHYSKRQLWPQCFPGDCTDTNVGKY